MAKKATDKRTNEGVVIANVIRNLKFKDEDMEGKSNEQIAVAATKALKARGIDHIVKAEDVEGVQPRKKRGEKGDTARNDSVTVEEIIRLAEAAKPFGGVDRLLELVEKLAALEDEFHGLARVKKIAESAGKLEAIYRR